MSFKDKDAKFIDEIKIGVVINFLSGHLCYKKSTGESMRGILDLLKKDGVELDELKEMSSNGIGSQNDGDKNVASMAGTMGRMMFEDLPSDKQLKSFSILVKRMTTFAATIQPSQRNVVNEAIDYLVCKIKDKSVAAGLERFMEQEGI